MPFSDVIGHARPLAFLQTALRQDRLAHAYLFYGDEGIGKRLVALRLAQAIHCESGDGTDACGACRACRQIEAQTYPDFFVIEPEHDQAYPQIKLEQIRAIEQQIVYHPFVGRKKIFLIDDAHRMTLSAANALLKTLEEPPAHSLLLLISSRPWALPATVRSRCQALRFAPPTRSEVETALIRTRHLAQADARLLVAVSQSRIGAALTMDPTTVRAARDELCTLVAPETLRSASTILTMVERYHKADRGPEVLTWVAQWVRDLLLVSVGADPELLIHTDRLALLRTAVRGAQVEELAALLDDLDALERAASRHLNFQLALETTLLRLREITLRKDKLTPVYGPQEKSR
jgi:DNA polymerase-3 subunit delta'